ncbi:MAG TPA: SDR family oxidoreductase [Hyphomonadaceae bacterium]|nr:SDR family oxidoreductase [Hyphomonadaceae bacterium]
MADSFDFSGRTVLVVGGSSGIGNGIAHAFRRNGATVHVWGTRASAADYAGEEGSDLAGLAYAQMDVSDFAAIEVHAPPFKTLDVLVNCQGTVIYKRGEFAMDGFQRVIDVNLNSIMACAMKFRPMLAATKGSIINISSTSAYHTTLGNPAYGTSKAACVALTKNLAHALAKEGIRVNGVAPGLVDTKLTKVTTENPERLKASLEQIPLHRLGQPADIAGAVLFLASPHASYVIGHTIPVDGGLIL